MGHTFKKRKVIGRRAIIRVGGEQYWGTVIDATHDHRAKRIRIQSPGSRQGNVVMPGEYGLIEFDD